MKKMVNGKMKKVNRYEAMNIRAEKFNHHVKGEGLYIYKNGTSGILDLPKPDKNGKTSLAVNEEFEGDNYFMSLVSSGSAKIIREVMSPEEERKQMMLNEQKLILDQPNRVTTAGTVEQVVAGTQPTKKDKKLQEQIPATSPLDVLLTEDPLDGITILG